MKQFYPNVKLRIPGDVSFPSPDRRSKSPYYVYLHQLAIELGILDNIELIGKLNSQEMAVHMRKSHIFIMPSAIENLSTTLREAMLIGMPCISSSVGCVNEYINDGANAYVYRYEEWQHLAQIILKLFKQKEKEIVRVSENARKTIFKLYVSNSCGNELLSIYTKYTNI